jgi:septum formation protein
MSNHNSQHLYPNLDGYRIILASNSPRRRQLLQQLGLQFEVVTKSGIDESFPASLPINDIAPYLAQKKVLPYQDELSKGESLLITADTIVAIDEQVLGKPANYQQAVAMLQLLSGRNHRVLTGVAITTLYQQVVFFAETHVWFKSLTSNEIDYYVTNFKPFDKAGGYGIQEWIGLIGVEKVEGSYYNVVGLPVQKLHTALCEIAPVARKH